MSIYPEHYLLNLKNVKAGEIFSTYSFSEAGVEGIPLQTASAPDSGGHNIFAGGVNVYKGVHVTEICWWMFVSGLETLMVVFNDGVEDGSEEGIRLGIRSVDTDATVQVFNA